MTAQRSERFEYLSPLGQGGMGVVHEAFDRSRGMRVAIKSLKFLDAASVLRLKHEFRIARDLSHPNLINLFELVADRDGWLVSMEVIEGTDFVTYVRNGREPPVAREGVRPAVDQLVDLERFQKALSQLVLGLIALHDAGIVHQDIKPSNVRVTPEGRVVIMDFGISTLVANNDDMRGSRVGTPAFMAPEQITADPISTATDWYAVGVMVFLTLTGRLPFAGTRQRILNQKLANTARPASEFVEDISPEFVTMCAKLLSRKPQRRPSGRDLLSALGEQERPPRAPVAPSFIGRERELAVLESALLDADAGTFRAVEIRGPSGIGKSRLIEEFSTRLAHGAGRFRPRIFIGRCHDRESLAFKAFDAVFDQIAISLARTDPVRVVAALPEEIDLVARLFPVLRQVAAIGKAAVISTPDPVALRTRAFAAVATLLENLAAPNVLVLAIDDVQWADEDSLDLLREIETIRCPPGVLLITVRRTAASTQTTPTLADGGFARAATIVELSPLSSGEEAALVQALCSSANAAAIPRRLVAECEGSPLLLTELARFASDRSVAAPMSALQSVEQVIAERIAELPTEERLAAEVLGVAGEPLPSGVLSEICQLAPQALDRCLSRLKADALIRVIESQGEHAFELSHDKFVLAATLSLSDAELRGIHRRIAVALEAWPPAQPGSIARHWVAAAVPLRASRYLMAAARAAAASLAFERAATLYTACLELGRAHGLKEPQEVEVELASAFEYGGRHQEAARLLTSLAAGARGVEQSKLRVRAASNLLRAGDVTQGVEQLRAGLRSIDVELPINVPSALVQMGRGTLVRWTRGRTARTFSSEEERESLRLKVEALHTVALTLSTIDVFRGAAAYQLYLESATALGDPVWLCRARALGFGYRGVTGLRDYAEEAREVLATARALEDGYGVALASLATGTMAFLRGRYRSAIDYLSTAYRAFAAGNLGAVAWELTTARFFRELAFLYAGKLGAFSGALDESLAECDRQRDAYAGNLHRCEPSAWRAVIADDLETGRALVTRGFEGWVDEAPYLAHVNAAHGQALLALYAGAPAEAIAALDAVSFAQRLLRLAVPHVGLLNIEIRGRAAAMRGDHSGVERAARAAARCRHLLGPASSALLHAVAAAGRGRRSQALPHALRAVDLYSVAGAAHLDAVARFVAGTLEGGEAGDQRAERALLWLRDQQVASPKRFIGLFAPGF